ncbi:MAG: sulfatase-like hydrolase/transferase, partial [Burkholderiaceae bacterium]
QERLGAYPWELPEDMHSDIFVPQMATLWLDRYHGEEPFFLQVGIPGPHPPYDPLQRYVDPYLRKELPKAIRDYDLDSQPAALRKLRQQHLDNDHDAIVHLANPSDEQLHRQRAHYYANVSMIDTQVGELIDALDRRGVLDDTVIIFTSDHGDCLNDHGHSQKWSMFEQSVRVPGIISWSGHITGDHHVTDLVAMFDLGPTILELAGVTPPGWMEAQSLTPYFSQSTDPSRVRVFAEHAEDLILEHVEFVTMVREGPWKLVHFLGDTEGQLFKLDEDPGERRNLWDDPVYADQRQQLIAEILNWRLRSSKKAQGFVNAATTVS